MPSLKMSVPHKLERQDAEERLKGLLEKIKERYQDSISNLHEEWGEHSGKFSFTAYGFNVKCAAEVEPEEVKINGELPFAAMMFKGKIEKEIRDTLTRILGGPRRGKDAASGDVA